MKDDEDFNSFLRRCWWLLPYKGFFFSHGWTDPDQRRLGEDFVPSVVENESRPSSENPSPLFTRDSTMSEDPETRRLLSLMAKTDFSRWRVGSRSKRNKREVTEKKWKVVRSGQCWRDVLLRAARRREVQLLFGITRLLPRADGLLRLWPLLQEWARCRLGTGFRYAWNSISLSFFKSHFTLCYTSE